jgi:hypothetical protein
MPEGHVFGREGWFGFVKEREQLPLALGQGKPLPERSSRFSFPRRDEAAQLVLVAMETTDPTSGRAALP